MLKGFKNWLNNRRHFLFSWYTKDVRETQEPERSLVELPSDVRQKLVDAVENLPNNPAEQKAISEELDKAFNRWREHPNNTDNSVVILSSPVASVARILTETLNGWTDEKQISVRIFPITARPTNIENIKIKLEHYLHDKGNSEDELEVVVIPNLSWCFLRSFEGLEGIEYLKSLLCDGSKNRFWIIGAGQVGWEYLNSVCNLQAYLGDTFKLPGTSGKDLREWFEPIVEELEITFDKPRIDKQLLEGDKDNQTNYFEHLANISQGVSIVAVQCFLKSICYEDEAETESSQQKLVAQIPKLKDLSDLDSTDQYLLYSLLLHGDLTIATLAESLGDEPSEVQARIQLLRRQGIIEQQEKVIKINPLHYPRLKQRLAGNNFIIGRQ